MQSILFQLDVWNNSKEWTVDSKNGPFCITGGIELIGENIRFGDGASLEHYALCRCGASKNKPFCDGEHGRILGMNNSSIHGIWDLGFDRTIYQIS
ncbi:MAG: CDGSH iron-sulfur domain-containing protein [Nitrososphaeraceae archaeon]